MACTCFQCWRTGVWRVCQAWVCRGRMSNHASSVMTSEVWAACFFPFLLCWVFAKTGTGFCQMPLQHLSRWSQFFVHLLLWWVALAALFVVIPFAFLNVEFSQPGGMFFCGTGFGFVRFCCLHLYAQARWPREFHVSFGSLVTFCFCCQDYTGFAGLGEESLSSPPPISFFPFSYSLGGCMIEIFYLLKSLRKLSSEKSDSDTLT